MYSSQISFAYPTWIWPNVDRLIYSNGSLYLRVSIHVIVPSRDCVPHLPATNFLPIWQLFCVFLGLSHHVSIPNTWPWLEPEKHRMGNLQIYTMPTGALRSLWLIGILELFNSYTALLFCKCIVFICSVRMFKMCMSFLIHWVGRTSQFYWPLR